MKITMLLPFSLIIGLAVLGIVVYPASDFIEIGERNIVHEPRSTMEVLQRNTPVQFRLLDDRWGAMTVTNPGQLYDLWSVLERLEIRAETAGGENGHIEGLLEFFDGSQRRYRIPHQFKLDDLLLSAVDNQRQEPDLFETLLYALQTKETLMVAIRQANQISGFAASQPSAALDMQEKLLFGGQDRRVLLDRLAQSERIIDTTELAFFLAIYGDNPFYHIVLPVTNGSDTYDIIISVLSYSYFYVTDMRFDQDKVIYFRGNLLQFMEERLF